MPIDYKDREYELWPDLHVYVESLDLIPMDAERALFGRRRNSHRGISSRIHLKKFCARLVNQEFLEEICELKNLEFLELDWVTAEHLAPITRLKKLKTLKINGPRNVIRFDDLLKVPKLRKLFVCNAKHLTDLEFLSDAHHLGSIGVEGSMWTLQKIDSLRPLSGLKRLEALFMSSVQLKDKDLSYLASCPRLKLLECARFAPKARFLELGSLMPKLECKWCDEDGYHFPERFAKLLDDKLPAGQC